MFIPAANRHVVVDAILSAIAGDLRNERSGGATAPAAMSQGRRERQPAGPGLNRKGCGQRGGQNDRTTEVAAWAMTGRRLRPSSARRWRWVSWP